MNTGKRVWYILTLAILVLFLVGCGAGGGEAAPQDGGTGNNAGAASDTGGDTGAAAAAAGQLVVTDVDEGKTMEMKLGDTVVVQLSPDYEWKLAVTPTFNLAEIKEGLPEGAQGLYEAKMNGKATIQATGKPTCLKNDPPCDKPTKQFNVNITIARP